MLIPKKQGSQKSKLPDWVDEKKLRKTAKKKNLLPEKVKNLISKHTKTPMKQIVFSYTCVKCMKSYGADFLRKQIIEAARRGDSYISCPKCGVSLIADRTTKVSTKQNSKVNRNANLTAVYPNQGITPEYAPQTWIDRALLEKIAHELGKFAASVGMFNPQLKFQRGIRGKISANAVENVKAAEYTIEAVDDYDLRFRVVAAAGITPAGKVVLPKYFMTLDGREIPFTKEAVAEFLSGKVFGSTDPKPVVPELHYKDRDPVRFREIVASKKKADRYDTLAKDVIRDAGITSESDPEWVNDIIRDYMSGANTLRETKIVTKKVKQLLGIQKEAAGTPTPGQTVEYQGKNYTIDSITGDASILTDEAGVQTAPVPNADLNVQFEEGAMPAEISAPTLADRINKLVKRSLRDEKTLVPFTDPDPDYSVTKQTDVDADFSVPYKDSDQGILSEEERAVQKMFRGGSVIKPVKTAAVRDIDELSDDLLSDFDDYLGWVDKEGSYEKALEGWLKVRKYTLTEDEIQYLLRDIKQKAKDIGLETESKKESSIKKTALTTWVDCNVEEPKPGYTVKGEKGEGTVVGFWDKGVTVSFEGEEVELYAGDDFVFDRTPYKLYDAEGNYIPVKENYEKQQEEWNKESSIKKTAEEIRWEKLLSDFSYAAEKEGGVENWVRVWGGSLDNIDSIDKAINDWASENGLEVTDDDVLELRTFLITQAKTSSRKKTAEPTGYHETDDTGKVIELSRLRTLVQDYARAGQLPLDFDLTKVMSEVSRMTRKDLLEILDKKQKGQHYPVVHAKKEGLEKKAGTWALPFTVNRAQRLQKLVDEYAMKEEYDPEALQSVLNALIGDDELYDDLDKAKNSAEAVELIKARLGYFLSDYEEDPENFRDKLEAPAKEILVGIVTASNKKVLKIGSKSTNAIVREIRKADLTEEDIKKDIKEEEEGEKHYNQMAKDVDSPKTEKVLKDMADEEAEHAEDLEEIVLPAVKNTQNYLEKYDSRKKKAQEEEEPPVYRCERCGETITEDEAIESKYECPWCGSDNVEEMTKSSVYKKTAQEEGEEEKPKTTLKELKTKPHGRPAPEEVAEAPAAAPELQTVFNEVKKHQQRLTEIKALINKARQKTEEEIRKIQEEQGSVEEAVEMQEGIEKLSSLIEQSESQIADLGEFFVWLNTESKTKKFKPSDKWRVEKLLEKFGKDAEEYLSKAERGASSLDTEIEQRLLTVFPKLPKDKEGSIQKKADVYDSIKELGSGLWNYIKAVSGIISEGEQLELFAFEE